MKLATLPAVVLLAASLSFAAPAAHAEEVGQPCKEFICPEPPPCDPERVDKMVQGFLSTQARLEGEVSVLERRVQRQAVVIDRKNATIKRLRAALAAQR